MPTRALRGPLWLEHKVDGQKGYGAGKEGTQ